MLRFRKRLSRFAFLVTVLLFAPIDASNAKALDVIAYPAGTRLAVPSAPEIRFRIAAEGPSVLWIRAESPHLLKLKVENAEASAWVEAMDGWAECVLPVYEAGPVDVMLTAVGMGGDIVVTSSYGIGTTWDAAAVSRALPAPTPPTSAQPPSSAPSPSDAPTAAVPPAQPAPEVAPAAPSISERPVPSPPQPVIVVAPPTPPPPSASPSSSTSPTAREIPILTNPSSISVGDLATGFFPESGEPGLATYRVYIPNGLGFSVWVNGQVHVRVRAADGISEMGDYSAATQKLIRFPAPSESWYVIALRGFGPYGVSVSTER